MSKINILNNDIKINYRLFFNDFDIFYIKASTWDTNLIEKLGSYKEHIFAGFFAKSTELYLLVDKYMIDIDDIEELFPEDIVKEVENVETFIILNLLLLKESSRYSSFDYIVNDSFYYIVKSDEKIAETLKFRFCLKDKDCFLLCDLNTFSKYSCLRAEDKSAFSNFYLIGDKTLKRVFNRTGILEENLYVKKNVNGFVKNGIFYGDKSSANTLGLTLNGKTKIDESKMYFISKIYKMIKDSKYVENFDFKNIEFEEYRNKSFKKLKENKLNFFEKNILNIVYHRELTEEELKELKKLNIKYQFGKRDSSLCNLCLKDYVGKDNNENVDIIFEDEEYRKDIKSGDVCQHLDIKKINDSAALQTCLTELVIKYEIKNKKINIFDFDIISSNKSKTYSFYSFYIENLGTKIKPKQQYYYNLLKINCNGDILDCKIKEEEPFDKYARYLKTNTNSRFASMGLVVDSDGNALLINDTINYILVDNMLEFLKDIEDAIAGQNLNIDGNFIWEMFEYIKNKTKDKKVIDELDKIISINTAIYQGSEEMVYMKDLGFSRPTKAKREVDEYIKNSKGLPFIFAIKGKDYLGGFKNIHFNDNYYCVGVDDMSKNIPNNIIIKEIEVMEGTNIIKDLLPMFFVPFVRNNQLTIKPFPFKYLDELVKNTNLWS